MSDFSSQLLRDVILDHSMVDPNQPLQSFEMRTDDVSVMKTYMDQGTRMLTAAQKAAIENVRNENQEVEINVYQKLAEGTDTNRERGDGFAGEGPEPDTIKPPYFTPIVEKLDMSLVQHALRQYGGEGAPAQDVIRRAYMDHLGKALPQVVRNIYTRAETQFVARLENNIWDLETTPDAGTVYTTTLNGAKQIPAADKLNVLSRIGIEARQNNFAVTGKPTLICSTTALDTINAHIARGSNNEVNLEQFVGDFNITVSNTLVDRAGVQATFYLVYPDALAGYNKVFKYSADPSAVNGEVKVGNDIYMEQAFGGNDASFLSNLPGINTEVKIFEGTEDTQGISGIGASQDEAAIDIVRNYRFTTTLGGFESYSSDNAAGGVSPIIKYELLDA